MKVFRDPGPLSGICTARDKFATQYEAIIMCVNEPFFLVHSSTNTPNIFYKGCSQISHLRNNPNTFPSFALCFPKTSVEGGVTSGLL